MTDNITMLRKAAEIGWDQAVRPYSMRMVRSQK